MIAVDQKVFEPTPATKHSGPYLAWLGACHYARRVARTKGAGSIEHRVACMVAKRARDEVLAWYARGK